MQSELPGLYDEYYRYACDTVRRAEWTMKREPIRSHQMDRKLYGFIKNFWLLVDLCE